MKAKQRFSHLFNSLKPTGAASAKRVNCFCYAQHKAGCMAEYVCFMPTRQRSSRREKNILMHMWKGGSRLGEVSTESWGWWVAFLSHTTRSFMPIAGLPCFSEGRCCCQCYSKAWQMAYKCLLYSEKESRFRSFYRRWSFCGIFKHNQSCSVTALAAPCRDVVLPMVGELTVYCISTIISPIFVYFALHLGSFRQLHF